ncbi:unnamed protein product, partial [Closterium sp. NIES-54]
MFLLSVLNYEPSGPLAAHLLSLTHPVAHINEFGQTPRQLFIHPHPQRSPRATSSLDSLPSCDPSTSVHLLMRLLPLLPSAAAAAGATAADVTATPAAAPAAPPAVAGSGAGGSTGVDSSAVDSDRATSGSGGTGSALATSGTYAAGGASSRDACSDDAAAAAADTGWTVDDAAAVPGAAAAASVLRTEVGDVSAALAAGEESAALGAAVTGAGGTATAGMMRLETTEGTATARADAAVEGAASLEPAAPAPSASAADITSVMRQVSTTSDSTAGEADGGSSETDGTGGMMRSGGMTAAEDESGRLKALLQGAVGLGSFNARRVAQGKGATAAARAASAVSAVSAVGAVGAAGNAADIAIGPRSTPGFAREAAMREGEEMVALREWLGEVGVGRGREEPPVCSPPFSPTAPFPAFHPSPVDPCSGGISTGESEGSVKGSGSRSSMESSGVSTAVSSNKNGEASRSEGGIGSSETSSSNSGSGSGRRRARVHRVKAHRGAVVAVAVAEHAESHDLLLTTAGADGMVKPISPPLLPSQVTSALLCSSPGLSHQSVLLGSSDDHVWLYSPDFGRCLSKMHAHDDTVSCIQVSQWGADTCLFTASWDSSVKQWSMAHSPFLSASPFSSFSSSSPHSHGGSDTSVHPPPLAELNQHDAPITSLQVAIPATSAWPLAASGSANGAVLLWDMRAPPSASVPWSCRLSPLTTTAPTSPLAVTGLVFSYGGLHVTTADSTGGLRVLEMRMGGAELASQHCPGGGLRCCQPLGDQSVLAG